MIVAFDNTFLSLVLHPDAEPTPNPATGEPVSYWKERIDSLITRHSEARDTVIIPAPCLAELLSAVPDVHKAIDEISSSTSFLAAPFDAKCAVEFAIRTREAIEAGDKRSGVQADWSVVKFDRQIAVIALVNGAKTFYTDDGTQAKFAEMLGMKVLHTWDLELENRQVSLGLNETEE